MGTGIFSLGISPVSFSTEGQEVWVRGSGTGVGAGLAVAEPRGSRPRFAFWKRRQGLARELHKGDRPLPSSSALPFRNYD